MNNIFNIYLQLHSAHAKRLKESHLPLDNETRKLLHHFKLARYSSK
jgi:hypothetical protein